MPRLKPATVDREAPGRPGMSKTAIVIGATGLVGTELTRLLLEHADYTTVRAFVRRPSGFEHPILDERIVDFERIADWQDSFTGDVLFSTLGTTLKSAGSKEAQYRVDFTYQYEAARAASRNGVDAYVLVSSAGANRNARVFYSRMKGELEQAIEELPFRRVVILRPSILVGEREEPRPMERIGAALATAIARIVPPLRKYRPIPAETVARAMINGASSNRPPGIETFESDDIFGLAEAPAPRP